MANTYTQISSAVTVGVGGAATMSFTSIPSTYTDLVVKLTTRDTAITANTGAVKVTFNSSATSYTNKNITGSGSAAASGSAGTTYIDAGLNGAMPTTGNTASTFSNIEIYIPNYAGSNYKSVSVDAVGENNATASYVGLVAGLWSNTAAITSISIAPTTLFAQYSSATLYGISKS
jgi:hypothetical protein